MFSIQLSGDHCTIFWPSAVFSLVCVSLHYHSHLCSKVLIPFKYTSTNGFFCDHELLFGFFLDVAKIFAVLSIFYVGIYNTSYIKRHNTNTVHLIQVLKYCLNQEVPLNILVCLLVEGLLHKLNFIV